MRLSEALAAAPENQDAPERGRLSEIMAAAPVGPERGRLSEVLAAAETQEAPPPTGASHLSPAPTEASPAPSAPSAFIPPPFQIPGAAPEEQAPAVAQGEPDLILPNALRVPATIPDSLKKFISPPERKRTPFAVVEDLQAGKEGITGEELASVIGYLERGAFDKPETIRQLLSLRLTPQGLAAVDEAILVNKLAGEAPARNMIPGGQTAEAFVEGLQKGLTANMAQPRLPTSGAPSTRRLLDAAGRVAEKEGAERRGQHPIASFGGEAIGSTLPFAAAVNLLRGVRAARGLEAVRPGVQGAVAEGAVVGGPLEFARSPDGAEQMSTEEKLTARALQGGIGLAAGAVLDFGTYKVGEFVQAVASAMKDRRTAQALKAEAKSKGFDSADKYLAAMVDVVRTDEGVVVRPKAEVARALPGVERAPETAQEALEAPAQPEALPSPSSAPEPGEAAPAPVDFEARIGEYERLARATNDPSIRQELLANVDRLRKEQAAAAEGAKPKLTPRERMAQARRPDPERDDLITMIRKLGGIDTSIETDWAGRLKHLPHKVFGLPGIERPGKGRSLDDLAESLQDLGYLRNRDPRELEELLSRAESGDPVYSLARREFDELEEAERYRYESTDDDWTFWEKVDDPRAVEADFVIDADDGTIVPSRPLDESDLDILSEELRRAEEGLDTGGRTGSDIRAPESVRVPERGERSLPGREGDQPRAEEGPELPGAGARGADADEAVRPLSQDEADQLWFLREKEIETGELTPAERQELEALSRREGRELDGTGFSIREEKDRSHGVSQAPGGNDAAGRPQADVQLFLPERAGDDTHSSIVRAFGPRVRHVQTGTFPTGLRQVTSAADVAHVAAPLRREAQESLLAVVADAEGNVLRMARIHKGSRDAASVDPGLVASTAASTPGGARVWFVHNHPSGMVGQTEPDLALTARLHELLKGSGVEPQGMVVVGPGGRKFTHYQPPAGVTTAMPDRFRIEEGELADGATLQDTTAAPRRESLPVSERQLIGTGRPGPEINRPEDLADFVRTLPDEEGLVLLDTRSRPVGWLPMSASEMRQLRQGAGGPSQRLLSALDEVNASGFAARIKNENEALAAAGNLNGFANLHGTNLLDVLDGNYRSKVTGEGIPAQSTFYSNPFTLGIGDLWRDIRSNPGRHLASEFAGGVAGATLSEEEPFSDKWWLAVATGAVAATGASYFLRGTNLLGKGSLVDNARLRLGRAIEKLPMIGRGPTELRELKRKQRVMQQIIDRQTETVGQHLLKQFTPEERATMADIIENRGIIPDLNLVHRQAQALDDYISEAGQRMKDLGMLPEDLEVGGYLHRYYAKHLGLDKMFREAKRQTLSGSYTLARGTNESFDRRYFSPGAERVVGEFASVRRELQRLEKRAGDLLGDDTAGRIAEHKRRLRGLSGVEFVEYVGRENGKVRSFFFTADELPRVDAGVGSRLAQVDHPGPALDPRAMGVAHLEELEPTGRVWSVRGVKGNETLLHRDWTKAERQAWGEIEDAGYRYVRGMAEVAHDLSLATLYDTVGRRSDWVSDEARLTGTGKPWVLVPDTKVGKRSPLKTYGGLAGKYVRPDVWNGIRNYGRAPFAPGAVGDLYRGALSRWKLYKTVYNPVTHLNNTFSNVEMLYSAGYGGVDLANGLRHMVKNEGSEVWREARDAGLFGTDWATSLLKTSEGGGNRVLEELAESLRTQPEIPDAALSTSLLMDFKRWWIDSSNAVRDAEGSWKSGAALAKAMAQPVMKGVKFSLRPVGAAARSAQRLYRVEDELFKMAVYAAERKKGRTPEQAVQDAQGFFFDYSDLPEAMKWVRDFPVGSPFISYNYFAIPAIARNVTQNPERILALQAAYEAWNYAAMVAEGDMEPGTYWARERAEDVMSPPWEQGRALWGARNMVHLPFPESYRLALGRAHMLGNPFMSEAGGREKLPAVPYAANFWGSSFLGSNPLHALVDVVVNEDWKGKEIYSPGAPSEEKSRAVMAYLYQAWAPSNVLTPGSYHQQRLLEGLANDARKAREEGGQAVIAPVVDIANGVSQALGFEEFTGVDRLDREIQTRDALLASFGVKLRPYEPELTFEFSMGDIAKDEKSLNKWFDSILRLNAEGRVSDERVEALRRLYDRELARIAGKEKVLFDADQFLRGDPGKN